MELSAEGLLSSTPTDLGTYAFTVQVVDANDLLATRDYTLIVNFPSTSNPGGLYLMAVNIAISFDDSLSSDPDGAPP